jgi:GntR family transcriptional regulator
MDEKFSKINFSQVDRNSLIPLYQQIYMDITSLINANVLRPEETLPPEIFLSKRYKVSRQTVRQSLKKLENENLIKRTPGKGTTILSGINRMRFFLDRSFAIQLREMDKKPVTEVLKRNITVISKKSPLSLHSKIGSPSLELHRLRYENNEPIGVQYSEIILERCPDLPNMDFINSSLYETLMTKYRLPINRIDQKVCAVLADEWHASILKIKKPAPLLFVTTTAYLESGEPIEASISYYRADKYEFSTTHQY